MNFSLYQGRGIKHPGKTLFIASIGKCGHEGYRELQVYRSNGSFGAIVTDGYKYLSIVKHYNNLKDALKLLNEHK